MKKVSLRDLFWLVILVAMGLGWWVDRSRLAAALGMLGNVQGSITVDGQPLETGHAYFRLDDGRCFGSAIENGRYRITHVPVGNWPFVVQMNDGLPPFSGESTTVRVMVAPGENMTTLEVARAALKAERDGDPGLRSKASDQPRRSN